MVYMTLTTSHEPPVPEHTTPAPATPGAKPAAPPSVAAPKPTPVSVLPPLPAPPSTPPPQRLARVSDALTEAAVSSEGGKLQEWTLKYRGVKPMIIIGELGPLGLVLAPGGDAAGQVVPMTLEPESLTLGPERSTGSITLTGAVGALRVREELGFHAGEYTIDARVRVENAGPTRQSPTIALPWATRQDWRDEKTHEKFQGQHPTEIFWATSAGAIERVENLCKTPTLSTDGKWIGTGSIWYMAALIPRAGDFKLVAHGDEAACESKSKEPVGRATIAVQATPTLAPGQSWEGAVTIYAGPKEYERLRALDLEGAVNFGCFPVPCEVKGLPIPALPMRWLGVPILLLMKWVYDHIHSWGLAIILLTVVSKILFYPLTVKSMRSMKSMQALQPQINALRSKYKSDPTRLQKETMELYREHKVNPLGGCLPMVAQIPIFYALYLALANSVELQDATFLCLHALDPLAAALRWMGAHWIQGLWICNLSASDPLYVLPILMGISMFMQQRMSPTSSDPSQAKVMLVMPFVFTLMFMNLASGLVLYWTVSNVLQILQQWSMDRSGRGAARPARA
jgi:YidC/Oxa1 family membrane protein insertase